MSRQHEPAGIRFFDNATQRDMVLVQDPTEDFDGWLCFRHPDGQWVTQRRATPDDLAKLGVAPRRSLSVGRSASHE